MVTKKKVKKKVTKKKATKKKSTKKKSTKKKSTKKKATRRVGRPTKYDSSMCEIAIEAMRKGFSKEAVAGHLEISKDTLYEWIKKNKEFSDSIKLGQELSRQFWEKASIEHLVHSKNTKQLNSTNWIFNMKNRFNWTDKKEISLEEETKKSFGFSLDVHPDEV